MSKSVHRKRDYRIASRSSLSHMRSDAPADTTNAGQGFRRQMGEHRGYEVAGAEVPRLMPVTAINLRRS